jgi:hypothetical protein
MGIGSVGGETAGEGEGERGLGMTSPKTESNN